MFDFALGYRLVCVVLFFVFDYFNSVGFVIDFFCSVAVV